MSAGGWESGRNKIIFVKQEVGRVWEDQIRRTTDSETLMSRAARIDD